MIKIEIPSLSSVTSEDLEIFKSESHPLSGVAFIQKLPFLALGCHKDLSILLPHELISSVLSLACHLLDCLSAVTNIPLLHPLHPFEADMSSICAIGDQT
jgi:hypothetical protein